MRDESLGELGRMILSDLAKSSLAGALPTELGSKANRRLPKSSVTVSGEDMDTRLRGIRRYITPKELAALMHWHLETVYRKVRGGMPVDRDVDEEGKGRRLKIYPPEIADWLRDCREAHRSRFGELSGPPRTARNG